MQAEPVASRRARPGHWIGSAALLLMLACGGEPPTRPDLVLITIDALAADRLPCFGGDAEVGEAVCGLARGGTLFAWTATPGRGAASAAATVLTGLPARRHGLRDDGYSFLSERHETIAERLSAAGYHAAAFVAQPALNRTRRLDQGFEHWLDAAEGPGTGPGEHLSDRVQDWLERTPAPRFLWIHADRSEGPAALDRLVARLARRLDPGRGDGPGLLFLALRGEAEAPGRLGWRSHRVPLIWRPPPATNAPPPAVSQRLATLADIPATLAAAAGLRDGGVSGPVPAGGGSGGRDLSDLARSGSVEAGTSEDGSEPRLVLLESADPTGEVGLATPTHLYARRPGPEDGSGRALPVSRLVEHGARFAALPLRDPLRDPAPRSGALQPGPWRTDVLSPESPVPRLEFHLAKRLARAGAENER